MSLASAVLVAALVVAAAPALAQPASQGDDPRRPSVCTEQYVPVYGRVDTIIKTYPNLCHARAAGAVVIAPGPCGEAAPVGGRRQL